MSKDLESEARELMEEVLVDAYGENKQLWSFRQAFEDEVNYPALGRLGGVFVSRRPFDSLRTGVRKSPE